MASIHETAEGLHAAGVLDKRTMREFDDLCLAGAPTQAQGNPHPSRAGGCQSSRLRPLSQRDDRLGKPVGTGREAPARSIPKAARTRRQEWVGSSCLMCETIKTRMLR